jgi:hypothetical protein
MTNMERIFNQSFADWNIAVPPDAVGRRAPGNVSRAGWSIVYRFGADAEGEFLDYYASHRMTDDSHVRIREDGRVERLPAVIGLRLASADPVEDARLHAAHARENREIEGMLEQKGFGIGAMDPGAARINRFLRLGYGDEPADGL